METLSSCPVCGHNQIENFLGSRDFFLTGKDFDIFLCKSCGVKFTNPRPGKEEIGEYYKSEEYISHDARKNDPFSLAYRAARSVSLNRKLQLVQRVSAGNNLLDIGCGTGEFANKCRNAGFNVTGIEPNPKAAGFARSQFGLNVHPEGYLDELPSESFDIITLWHVLEHIHDVNERMNSISRLLKPTGTLIIAVPNAGSPDAFQYGKFWAAYDLPRHLLHFSKESMKVLAERHNFSILQAMPMKMDAFYISLLSEKYATGSKNILNAFINGLQSNIKAERYMNYSSLIFILKKNP